MLFASQIHDFLRWLPSNRLKRKKQEVRSMVLQRIMRLSKEERAQMSQTLVERMKKQETFRNARVVMMYYPIKNEPDLRPLMEEFKDEKVILLPVSHRKKIEMRRYQGKENLHHGRFGIPEPMGVSYEGPAPDLIIVPGVAFDKELNRLGRGGGYYDRFLKRFRKAAKYAVAYDFQIVEKVPAASFDMKMDAVITVGTEFVHC